MAKRKKENELDVDFIGGEGPLTEAEAQALSAYFQQKKLERLQASKKRAG